MSAATAEESALEQKALDFAKTQKKSIAKRLTDINTYPPDEHPRVPIHGGLAGSWENRVGN